MPTEFTHRTTDFFDILIDVEVRDIKHLNIVIAALRANYFERGLQLGHRTGAQLRVMAGAAAITIGLNFLLIPLYGHVGAGVALAIAAVTSFVHAAMSAKRGVRHRDTSGNSSAPTIMEIR